LGRTIKTQGFHLTFFVFFIRHFRWRGFVIRAKQAVKPIVFIQAVSLIYFSPMASKAKPWVKSDQTNYRAASPSYNLRFQRGLYDIFILPNALRWAEITRTFSPYFSKIKKHSVWLEIPRLRSE